VTYEEDAAMYAEKGEQWVREMLATNRLGDARKHTAKTWLDLQAAARADAAQAEQADIARSALATAKEAADAARSQARSARRANRIAIAALIISVIAITISIMRQ
jgi:hypothetical protein